MLRKVASDDITGADPVQQLLRLLQAFEGQNRPGKSLLVLQQLIRPENQLDPTYYVTWNKTSMLQSSVFFLQTVLCHVFVLISHIIKNKYFCITLKTWCNSFVCAGETMLEVAPSGTVQSCYTLQTLHCSIVRSVPQRGALLLSGTDDIETAFLNVDKIEFKL